MGIELFSHNQIAYNKLLLSLVENNKVCIVQPTGTGKSFVMAKFIEDNPDSKFLIISSNNYILNQFDKRFSDKIINYHQVTYSSLLSKKIKELLLVEYDYIFLDEFHRAGAEEWGIKLREVLNHNSGSKIIGLTATPIRHLESERNLIGEFFDNNIAFYLTLNECFDKGILPRPKYITSKYTVEKDFKIIQDRIHNSNLKNKHYIEKRLLEYKLSWELSNGVVSVLKKHILKERNFLVFCKTIEHLDSMVPLVKKWFKNFYKSINIFIVHSKDLNSDQNLIDFENACLSNKDEFNLLFSIAQLNEGLHSKNVDGILFLRPTDSHIIFYQQLGRCLISKGTRPLVFDFVNNFKKSSVVLSLNNNEYNEEIRDHHLTTDYNDYKFSFIIEDETIDLSNYLGEFDIRNINKENNLIDFEKAINRVEKFSLLSRSERELFMSVKLYSRKGSYIFEKLSDIMNTYGYNVNDTIRFYEFIDQFNSHYSALNKHKDYYKLNKKEQNWIRTRLSHLNMNLLTVNKIPYFKKLSLIDESNFIKERVSTLHLINNDKLKKIKSHRSVSEVNSFLEILENYLKSNVVPCSRIYSNLKFFKKEAQNSYTIEELGLIYEKLDFLSHKYNFYWQADRVHYVSYHNTKILLEVNESVKFVDFIKYYKYLARHKYSKYSYDNRIVIEATIENIKVIDKLKTKKVVKSFGDHYKDFCETKSKNKRIDEPLTKYICYKRKNFKGLEDSDCIKLLEMVEYKSSFTKRTIYKQSELKAYVDKVNQKNFLLVE